MKSIELEDVVNGRLCVGCGACAYVSRGAVRMREFPQEGWRPVPVERGRDIPPDCMAVCPAVGTEVPAVAPAANCGLSRAAGLGPVLACWEVHAGDGPMRSRAASGGALSALAAYALEAQGMSAVLHIAQDPDDPFKNLPVLSRTRAELVDRAGSRYAPASLCERLDLVEGAAGPCVVIGQPSEIAALRKAEALRPALRKNVAITMSFFCAGSPAIDGTLELIRSRGIDPAKVSSLRYRGRGWPGQFAVWLEGEGEPALEMSYAESWAFLESYRPWSVHIWPDGAGEHADISCGDPWYRSVRPGEAGSSLVLARTVRGRELVEAALRDGYLVGEALEWAKVAKSQENLLAKKGSIAGRLFAMRLLNLNVPRHRGYGLARLWWKLPLVEKLRSIFGTLRRLVRRGYLRPGNYWPVPGAEPPPDGGPSRTAPIQP